MKKKRKLKNFFFPTLLFISYTFFLDKHTVCEREKLFIQKVYPPLLIKLNKLFFVHFFLSLRVPRWRKIEILCFFHLFKAPQFRFKVPSVCPICEENLLRWKNSCLIWIFHFEDNSTRFSTFFYSCLILNDEFILIPLFLLRLKAWTLESNQITLQFVQRENK